MKFQENFISELPAELGLMALFPVVLIKSDVLRGCIMRDWGLGCVRWGTKEMNPTVPSLVESGNQILEAVLWGGH